MAQAASQDVLSFVFGGEESPPDGLSDPFEVTTPARPAEGIRAGRQPRPRRAPSGAAADSAQEVDPGAATYTFRWDVEVPLEDRAKCGPKFMKQWKRVLQAQKLAPLVSAKLTPYGARFQLCVLGGGEAALVAEHEREIAEALARLRADTWPVSGEPAGSLPTGWQGVRVWMTFARRDVESALAKKPKI